MATFFSRRTVDDDVDDTIYLVCNPGYAYLMERSSMNGCASYHIKSSIYIYYRDLMVK